ncbi:putative V-type proton ATPase subunit G [Hypsibius exemplaris]|uniref:V-type proton ATPase subunit G n=1 Tax=Hypsibius exemplaris TaxID=2072580 RepID=A0A1W0X5A4_HYPEX|nr:putative V-type proton ATPase subunit G [Hypsibius exemplaris]
MATQTQGIQQLLAAEKKAADKVAEARKRKARRLKQAKEEAQAEIEKYREEREKAFKEYESHHLGSRDNIASKIDIETRKRIEAMNQRVDTSREQVIQNLLNIVNTVEPRLHKNYRG